MNIFDTFDKHWHENFASAVLALAFRTSPSFRAALLRRIAKGARGPSRAAALEPPDSYEVSREAGFEVRQRGRGKKGRFDVVLTSGRSTIAIENKIEAPLTRKQLRAQRQALRQQQPNGEILVCALTKYREQRLGEDVTLRWSDVVTLLPARDHPDRHAMGQELVDGMSAYFGGFDMSFKGFGRQGVFETHRQRGYLLEQLVERLKKPGTKASPFDKRPRDGAYHYQCWSFTDRYGGRDRFVGFYDYRAGDVTALELYPDEPSHKPIAELAWDEVMKTFPQGREDQEPALARLVKRFDGKLRALAPKPKRKSAVRAR